MARSLHELMEAERVTLAAGVPTAGQRLLAHGEARGPGLSTVRRTLLA